MSASLHAAQPARSDRITWMQYACALLIVLLHARNGSSLSQAASASAAGQAVLWVQDALSTISHMAVPAFFALSAYLFFRTYRPDQYLSKLRRRLQTLAVPYLIWNGIGFLYAYVASNVPLIAGMTGLSPVKLDWQVLPDLLMSAYTTLWYVRNLMAYFLLAPVIWWVVCRRWATALVMVGVTVYCLLAGYEYYSLLTWLPMYLMGAWAGVHHPRLHEGNTKLSSALRWGILLVCGIVCGFAVRSYGDTAAMYLHRLLSPIALWLIFDGLHLPPLRRFAKISFFLYCSHLYILPVFQKGLLLFLGHGWLPVLIVYLLTPGVIVLLLTGVAFFLQNSLPRLWALLNGGR